MATLRKFSCYRTPTRAYTRKSKYKPKAYVKAVPPSKVVRFNMGNYKKTFGCLVELISKGTVQIRDNAIESARQLTNRRLESKLGKEGYYFRVMIYPHHALRENKMLVGAGADRMQTGMQKAFGKVIGIAARVKKGQTIFKISVDKENIETAKYALKGANHRLPMPCSISIKEIKA